MTAAAIPLKGGNIDHVLVGPGGAFAVETKWSANNWHSGDGHRRFGEACDQVAGNTHTLSLWLRKAELGSVEPVLFLWGSASREHPGVETVRFHGREVTVVAGHRSAEWMAMLPLDRLDKGQVERAWSVLDDYCARRDPREDDEARVPLSMAELAMRGFMAVLAARAVSRRRLLVSAWAFRQVVAASALGANSARPGRSPVRSRSALHRLGVVVWRRNRRLAYFLRVDAMGTRTLGLTREATLQGHSLRVKPRHRFHSRIFRLQRRGIAMRGLLTVGGRVRGIVGDQPSNSSTGITEYIGQLLQVRHLSVVLGAGASSHLGSPQIRSLSNEIIADRIAESLEPLTAPELAALAALNPEDQGDLEILLTTLQSALSFAGATNSTALVVGNHEHAVDSLAGLRRKLNRSLAAQCRLPRTGYPASGRPAWEAHQTFFTRLLRARRSDLPRPRIFTTNYDLVIERALDGLGLPYVDGFAGTIERRMNLETYNYDIYRTHEATQDVVSRVDSMLHVYKLHGSLTWRFAGAGAQGGTVVSSESEGVADEDQGLVLIYPTPAKERDTLAFPYSDLFRLFSNTLQAPDTALLCIGYGFADEHINRIITGALSYNQSLSLLVVDPMGLYGDPSHLLGVEAEVGSSLGDFGVTPLESRPAALAALEDSRVSFLTGESACFENFAQIMPDPNRLEPEIDKRSLAIQLQDAAARLGLQP